MHAFSRRRLCYKHEEVRCGETLSTVVGPIECGVGGVASLLVVVGDCKSVRICRGIRTIRLFQAFCIQRCLVLDVLMPGLLPLRFVEAAVAKVKCRYAQRLYTVYLSGKTCHQQFMKDSFRTNLFS